MTDLVLTLNAGSSSIKFALYEPLDDGPALRAGGQVEGLSSRAAFHGRRADGTAVRDVALDPPGPASHRAALETILAYIGDTFPHARIAAVGHRVVHGGPDFAAPVRIDATVTARLERLVPLAPLHQPHNLAGVAAAHDAFPDAVQVACFDTAFHRGHPFVADAFALPRALYEEGIRRYGFHGLSYEYVARTLRSVAPAAADGGAVIAHLGNGASMAAVHRGRSVASTMGFTALDGLPMGTRCGQLDPGVVLYLLQEKGMSPAEVVDLLYNRSGLKGLSGLTNDMRQLLASGQAEARDAIDYFVARIRRELGGLALALPRLDAVVFTGGIGENAAAVRAAVLEGLDWFGITLDAEANRAGRTVISTPESRVTALVLRTDEEAMIARHTVDVAGLAPAAVAA